MEDRDAQRDYRLRRHQAATQLGQGIHANGIKAGQTYYVSKKQYRQYRVRLVRAVAS